MVIARRAAEKLLNNDPRLESPHNQNLKEQVIKKYGSTIWSRIS
jgi:hypothetical protein